MKAVLLALAATLAGCVSTAPRPMPLREGHVDGFGDHQLVVDQPVRVTVAWPCRHAFYAERGPEPEVVYRSPDECRPGLAATLECTGVACEVSQVDRTTTSIVYAVVAHEPGALSTSLALRDATGAHEEMTVADAVLPPPTPGDGDIACALRDAATGAFTACPAHVPANRDLFFATRDVSPGHRAAYDVYLDGRRVMPPDRWPPPEPGALECHYRDASAPRTPGEPIDCTGRPAPGPHSLVTIGGGRALARLDFTVGA